MNAIQAIYNSDFHPNICHVCKITENLLRCSRCKIVAYCSKKHQKIDWKSHKDFCKARGEAIETMKAHKADSMKEWLLIKNMRNGLMMHLLNRGLNQWELLICTYPRFCEVCFSEDVPFDCPNCKNAFFCSETHRNEHKEIHEKYCDELKLCLESTRLRFDRNGLGDKNFAVSNISNEILNLPDSLIDLLKLYDKNSNCDIEIIKRLMKSRCLSPVASILYGLEKCGFLNERLFHKNELCVHIVGGYNYELELLWKEMFELAFHWINNLISLQYFIIGPELSNNGTTEKFDDDLCATCKSKKASTYSTFHAQLYHDSVSHLKKPDVVVCFNSGLHHYIEWEESIKYLISNDVPLIITAFTEEEILADIKQIKRHASKGIKLLLKPQKNPFCERIPSRDCHSSENPIYYCNGFISVLKNK